MEAGACSKAARIRGSSFGIWTQAGADLVAVQMCRRKTKGRLRTGADADIAIVDPATVSDRSTYREPALGPIGIRHVLVNGVAVVANGRTVDGVRPGQPVRAPAMRP